MTIYQRKSQWKVGLVIFAMLIVGASILYTNFLARKLANEERKKIELLAKAIQEMDRLPVNSSNFDVSFLSSFIKDNNTIPVILTDGKGRITGSKNFDDHKIEADSTYLQQRLEDMKNAYAPIVIDLEKYYKNKGDTSSETKKKQYVYYSDSSILKQLRIYPYIQLLFISVFLFIAYLTFSAARRAEQNKVWLGMAKETAHQLGTPLSSLVAWIEILKETPNEQAQMVGREIAKDIGRLKLIADRFSKIGSDPKMEEVDLVKEVGKTVNYIRRRASGRVKVTFEDKDNPPIMIKLNTILFDWVIENLLKNALDAMDGTGAINVKLSDDGNGKITIDVSDTGKGIPKSKFKKVFEPGFSTKKRGWGLGLSLSKRIVEIYHGGRIFVSQSALNKGTTFRIILPKENV